jgi:hypothetical protein
MMRRCNHLLFIMVRLADLMEVSASGIPTSTPAHLLKCLKNYQQSEKERHGRQRERGGGVGRKREEGLQVATGQNVGCLFPREEIL